MILLDTHVWLDYLVGSISDKVLADALTNPDDKTLVSYASVWECYIKAAVGKLEIQPTLVQDSMSAGIEFLPISIEAIKLQADLPMNHRDPFDRLIIAEAINLEIQVISRDKVFRKYEPKLKLWRT